MPISTPRGAQIAASVPRPEFWASQPPAPIPPSNAPEQLLAHRPPSAPAVVTKVGPISPSLMGRRWTLGVFVAGVIALLGIPVFNIYYALSHKGVGSEDGSSHDEQGRPVSVYASENAIEFMVTSAPGSAAAHDDDGATARFARQDATGLRVTQAVEVPAHIQQVVWVGRSPIVLLGWEHFEDRRSRHNGEVGLISEAGYEPISGPSAHVWRSKQHVPSGKFHWPEPWWDLVASASHEAWLGRCEWGWEGDGGGCDQWEYFRLIPRPSIMTPESPEEGPRRALPVVSPSPEIRLELIDDRQPRPEAQLVQPTAGAPTKIQYLRCTSKDDVTEFPPDETSSLDKEDDRRSYFGVSNVVWISTNPPIYKVDIWNLWGIDDRLHPRQAIFQGCILSKQWDGATLEVGPEGTVGIVAQAHLLLIRRGQKVGTLDNVEMIRFAPTDR